MTTRKGLVYIGDRLAGKIEETGDGYVFSYDEGYFVNKEFPGVSLTMPKTQISYSSGVLFPFFDGLIPEGFSLRQVQKKWGIDEKDRFGALLKSCADPIGNVSIKEIL